MNNKIITQQAADVNELVNWERGESCKFKWHGKGLGELSRQDAKRRAAEAEALRLAAEHGVPAEPGLWM